MAFVMLGEVFQLLSKKLGKVHLGLCVRIELDRSFSDVSCSRRFDYASDMPSWGFNSQERDARII